MKDYIPPNLLQKAKEMDLLTYLMNFNPSELVKVSEDTYSTKTHDSLIISNNLWHRFSTNEGGKTALDYLIKVEGYSLQEAARIILNHQNIEIKQAIIVSIFGRLGAIIGANIAIYMDVKMLKKGFGFFLIAITINEIYSIFKLYKKDKKTDNKFRRYLKR